MKELKKSFKFTPIPPDPINCYTIIDSSMTGENMKLIVDIVMEDLERNSEYFSMKDFLSTINVIDIAAKASYIRYVDAVNYGRSLGYNYDPLNLVPF